MVIFNQRDINKTFRKVCNDHHISRNVFVSFLSHYKRTEEQKIRGYNLIHKLYPSVNINLKPPHQQYSSDTSALTKQEIDQETGPPGHLKYRRKQCLNGM